ncbi:unknown [Firmicutes bacterium CAG:238]|nr:unknown [Firmicutes bacterium CAG:238]
MIGIIGQFHLHLMINSAVDPAALFFFEDIRQSLRCGLAFIAPFGFLGVFGNIPGLARQKSAWDAPCRTVVANAALGGVPKRGYLFYG